MLGDCGPAVPRYESIVTGSRDAETKRTRSTWPRVTIYNTIEAPFKLTALFHVRHFKAVVAFGVPICMQPTCTDGEK
jgi:hypothetical protein